MAIKKSTLIKVLIISVFAVAALFAAAWFFVSYQISHLENYKDEITKAAGRALNRNITYEKGSASLTLENGLALQFTNIAVRDKNGQADLLFIPGAFFRVDVLPLLRNRLVLREIVIREPRLTIVRDRMGGLNIDDLLGSSQRPEVALEFRKITLERGELNFFDQAFGEKGLATSLTGLSCRIDSSMTSASLPFSIKAVLREGGNQAELSISGTFRPAPSGKPLAASVMEAALRLKGMNLQHYQPYLKSRIPFEHLAGFLDVEAVVSGTPADFTAKGAVTAKDVLLDYPQAFRKPLQPQTVSADFNLKGGTSRLTAEIKRFALDRFEASGQFALSDWDQDDPVISATVTTGDFTLKEIGSYIPWKIIPGKVAGFIEHHIREGDFRLTEGKLSGRKSRIINMEMPENADVLSIRAEVKNGVLTIGDKEPSFTDIRGMMELKSRKFSLSDVKARFGSSPCTVSGVISDFALPGPAHYTARMTIEPTRDDLLRLFGRNKFRKLIFQGISKLTLSGDGPADAYRVSASWDLTDAAYAWPDVVNKPPGRQNRLAADIVFGKNTVTFSSFSYDLTPVNVGGSAVYRLSGRNQLALNVRSNSFDLAELASVVPVLKAFNPAGICLVEAAGRGNPGDASSFRFQGGISLTGVSLQPAEGMKPVKGLTGKAVFRGDRLETSLFNARIGESAVSGKCTVGNFAGPQISCRFESALMRSTDIGWQSESKPVDFRDVKGRFAFAGENIDVTSLALRFGKSSFSLSGNVRGGADPRITLDIDSPYCDFADIMKLADLKQVGRKDGPAPRPDLAAKLRAAAGNVQGVDFRKLGTEFKFTGETLQIKALEAGLFDGTIKARGMVDIKAGGDNRYAANISAQKLSLAKIQEFLEVNDRLVSGNLSFTGDVTATGRGADDWKKTAVGTFQLNAERGVLKKFSSISKMFSLLNVLQLAKLKLPDMAEDGMPFDAITGKILLKNGVFSSEDFFVDSEAMELSASGKVDLLKEELDATVGVHPLGTIDDIVSKIPVAGWLVTDEKGHLITVHFKVDGKWDDPRVTAIPVRSLARGTLNIFRRLFQLPEKLITDTGEVILGH